MFEQSMKFERMKRIMRKLGFIEAIAQPPEVEQPQMLFHHGPTDTLFIFPIETTELDGARVESIRRIMVGRGVVSEDVLEKLLAVKPRASVG